MEELKLDLIREDVQNRKEFMARIISIEERKLALLERMATQGGNTQWQLQVIDTVNRYNNP